ncbi:hypothetical protein BGW37DRAFT_508456 [Umbelopsis sp. PMI_123]|nr:hypothetical protein BGW37DRAFT_508456 [Umbelopsis sp. PMI_123]
MAADDQQSRTIYVGNLDSRVSDQQVQDVFASVGSVESLKIMSPRKHTNYQYGQQAGFNYGFIEYTEAASAEKAINEFNGKKVFNHELKVNWAQGSNTGGKEDTSSHFHLFVGDLAPEITDEALNAAFSNFGPLTDAHVMWDQLSGKSRGFGFVVYKEKADAEKALAGMNGQWLGSRAIRCNWANQKGQTATPAPIPGQVLPIEIVISQAPAYVTTVYVGNLPPNLTQEEIAPVFGQFGIVHEIKMQADRGFAFVKLDSHEGAANAIVQLQGANMGGRPVKLSWGKNRSQDTNWQQYPMAGYQQNQQHNMRRHHQPYRGASYNMNTFPKVGGGRGAGGMDPQMFGNWPDQRQ